MSQEKLASEAGSDRTYIGLVERCVKSPTVRAVAKRFEVLEIRPSAMILSMEAQPTKGRKPEKKTAGSG